MLDSTDAGDLSAVRDHTRELIESASDVDGPVLIEAPPNSGKTTNAIRLAREAEKPVTYLARRIDLYEQAEQKAEEYDDLRYERIPALQRDCETFLGDNDGSPQQSSGSTKRGIRDGEYTWNSRTTLRAVWIATTSTP